MKIEIQPTGRFEGVNGQRCRVWDGVTDKGVTVEVFVKMVQEVKPERELVYFDNRILD